MQISNLNCSDTFSVAQAFFSQFTLEQWCHNDMLKSKFRASRQVHAKGMDTKAAKQFVAQLVAAADCTESEQKKRMEEMFGAPFSGELKFLQEPLTNSVVDALEARSDTVPVSQHWKF